MSNIQEKIDEITGTCEHLDLDDFTDEELIILDSQIFQCETCGWWCPLEEETEDRICTDCNE